MDCHGGPNMAVATGDTLLIRMSLHRSMWIQTVLDLKTNASVTFHMNLQNQAQSYAVFKIEPYGGATISDIAFTESLIEFANPDSNNCQITKRGPDDVITTPVPTYGGESCYIEKILLNRRPVTLTIKNNQGSTLNLYWIDYSGRRQSYGTLESGQSFTQSTF